MRITYYALKPVQVGEDMRQIGDLIPEAAQWSFLTGYVRDGHVAPVLVATLPESSQRMLMDWERAQNASVATPTTSGDQPAAKPKQKERVA